MVSAQDFRSRGTCDLALSKLKVTVLCALRHWQDYPFTLLKFQRIKFKCWLVTPRWTPSKSKVLEIILDIHYMVRCIR